MNYNFEELLGCLRLPLIIVSPITTATMTEAMVTVSYANPSAFMLLHEKNESSIDVEYKLPLLNAELLHANRLTTKTFSITESIKGKPYTLCISPLPEENSYIVEFFPEDVNLATFTQSSSECTDLTQTLKQEIIKKIIREASLIKENEYFKRLLNDLPVMVALKDSQFRYRYVNQSFCDFVYTTPKDILGKTDFDICTPKEGEYFRNIDRQVMETDQTIITEDTYTDAFDKVHHMLTTKTPIRDSDGNLNIQLVCIDITEIQQLKAQLQDIKAKYEEIADLTNTVVWVLDTNMRHTFISPSIEFFQGYTQEEFLQLDLRQSMTPESFQKALAQRDKIYAWYENQNYEELKKYHTGTYSYYHKDGSIVHGEIRFTVIIGSDNQMIGFQGITSKIIPPTV